MNIMHVLHVKKSAHQRLVHKHRDREHALEFEPRFSGPHYVTALIYKGVSSPTQQLSLLNIPNSELGKRVVWRHLDAFQLCDANIEPVVYVCGDIAADILSNQKAKVCYITTPRMLPEPCRSGRLIQLPCFVKGVRSGDEPTLFVDEHSGADAPFHLSPLSSPSDHDWHDR